MNKVLIVSQVVPQWFIEQIRMAFPQGVELTCITGSSVDNAAIVESPKYISDSYRTKLISWIKFARFLADWRKKNKEKYDLIVATSNPPFNSTIITKTKTDTPFVFVNWDLYPQSIIAYNSSFPMRLVYNIWNRVNDKYYPRIDHMVTLGSAMRDEINRCLSKPIDISVIPISVDTNRIQPVLREQNRFLLENGLMAKRIVLYSGAMGYAKNIELILETAKLMKGDQSITFVLIGSGPKYETAQKYKAENALENVRVFPLQPEDIFPFSIGCGDIVLLPEQIKKESTSIPSRTFSMMAAGEAIIAITHKENDLAKLIEDHELGIVIDKEQPELLKEAIYKVFEDETQLEKYKSNSRRLAVNEYSLEVANEKYKSIFGKLIGKI